MTLDQIRACNAQLKSLLDKKDYTNPSMKENIKKLKVLPPNILDHDLQSS